MLLYIVRHAIAGEHNPALWPDDRLRPLTDTGVERFRRAARGLRAVAPRVDHVLHSPFTRTEQTAHILHEKALWPVPDSCEALEPGRPPSDVLQALESLSSSGAVALVGHEPGLNELASYLITGEVGRIHADLRKGGTACFALDHGPQAGTARLVWWLTPKQLRWLDR